MNRRIEWYLIWVCIIIMLSGCWTIPEPTPTPAPPMHTPTALPAVTPLPPPTAVPDTSAASLECGQGETGEITWPHLDQVNPAQAAPGGEITVMGSGGYLRCNGGYNESARKFQLYFDGQPIGSITCYINHCEQTLSIPENIQSGMHSISVEGGSDISIEVADDIPTPCPPAPTPERSMPVEADTIHGRLTAAGLDQVRVSVTGFQNCPGIQTADVLGWIDMSVILSDPADADRFGEVITIIQASTTEWPEAPIYLVIYDTNTTLLAELDFTNQDVRVLQAAGFQGAALYEALLQLSQD